VPEVEKSSQQHEMGTSLVSKSLFRKATVQGKGPQEGSLLLERPGRFGRLVGLRQLVRLEEGVDLRAYEVHNGVMAQRLVSQGGAVRDLFPGMEKTQILLLDVCR
jgi:hypothetical protein